MKHPSEFVQTHALLAALGRGAALRRPSAREALRTGLVFGLVESVTPLIGWLAGVVASTYVQAVDHWIAFILLALVGGRMVLHAVKSVDESAQHQKSGAVLLATAIGTSIDAMAVGVSPASLDANILVVALAIGMATFTMSAGGMLAGRFIGKQFGRWAEFGGGGALFALGLSILLRHLYA